MILFHQFDANLMPQCVSGGQGGGGGGGGGGGRFLGQKNKLGLACSENFICCKLQESKVMSNLS